MVETVSMVLGIPLMHDDPDLSQPALIDPQLISSVFPNCIYTSKGLSVASIRSFSSSFNKHIRFFAAGSSARVHSLQPFAIHFVPGGFSHCHGPQDWFRGPCCPHPPFQLLHCICRLYGICTLEDEAASSQYYSPNRIYRIGHANRLYTVKRNHHRYQHYSGIAGGSQCHCFGLLLDPPGQPTLRPRSSYSIPIDGTMLSNGINPTSICRGCCLRPRNWPDLYLPSPCHRRWQDSPNSSCGA
jgi:hypothetical protein